jgi:hypothetical protein
MRPEMLVAWKRRIAVSWELHELTWSLLHEARHNIVRTRMWLATGRTSD